MNNLKNNNYGFTLIEIIVSITIFMIVIISITAIFIISTDISKKADINRTMQENIKNAIEIITEDVRKNGITGISNQIGTYQTINNIGNTYSSGTSLKVVNNTYYLSKNLGNRISTPSECEKINIHCYIYRKSTNNSLSGPITNSLVSVKKLNFYVSNDGTPKVTINITLKPSIKKGVKTNLIKESKIILQTTVSEKPF